jgi:hypothetical protein
MHTSVKAYRQALDPLSDMFIAPGDSQRPKLLSTVSSPYTGELATDTQLSLRRRAWRQSETVKNAGSATPQTAHLEAESAQPVTTRQGLPHGPSRPGRAARPERTRSMNRLEDLDLRLGDKDDRCADQSAGLHHQLA